MEDIEKDQPEKRGASFWLDKEVLDCLEIKARELGRTKSWLANFALRDKLGLPPEDGFKGKDKL